MRSFAGVPSIKVIWAVSKSRGGSVNVIVRILFEFFGWNLKKNSSAICGDSVIIPSRRYKGWFGLFGVGVVQ